MKYINSITRHALVLAFSVFCVSGQVLAADNDKRKDGDHNEQSESRNANMRGKFDNAHRDAIRNYFGEEVRKGNCPPGLAKKNNGCQPPGQAKRWQMGQNLRNDVDYRVMPNDLMSLLGKPQAGYHYGMVDSDILLLLDGSNMVIDAITNFGQ